MRLEDEAYLAVAELGLTAGAEAGDFLPADLQRSTFGRGFECAEDLE